MINISIKCHPYASQLCLFLFSLITSLFDSLRHGNIYIYIHMYIYIYMRVCVCVCEDLHIVILLWGLLVFISWNLEKRTSLQRNLYWYIYIYIVSGGDTCIHICIYLNMTMNIIIRTTMYWSSYIIFDMYQLYQNPCLTHWGLLDAYMRQ